MKNELYAPCGLYCGVCGVYMASCDNNQKLKDKFAKTYNVKSEQIACKGCLSEEIFFSVKYVVSEHVLQKRVLRGLIVVMSSLANRLMNSQYRLGKR